MINFTKSKRILFVANSYVPTLQLSFVKPLAKYFESGLISKDFLLSSQLRNEQWRVEGFQSPKDWIRFRFEKFNPTLVVFCRYSGLHSDLMLKLARRLGASSIYHIDDDLLGIPQDIGHEKWQHHNTQSRLDSVRFLLDRCDIVYASTVKLANHLRFVGIKSTIVNGEIYASGQVIRHACLQPVHKIGYMASEDHYHNLVHVIDPLVRLLRKHTNLTFEFFGTISMPPEFVEFGDRVQFVPKVSDYENFLLSFSERNWDIGICPLKRIDFNLFKADTKWVEYTSVGAAVVASKDTVYNESCSDGCGVLASSNDEWFEALDILVCDPNARFLQVARAQAKLRNLYSIELLRDQVLDVFLQAHRASSI